MIKAPVLNPYSSPYSNLIDPFKNPSMDPHSNYMKALHYTNAQGPEAGGPGAHFGFPGFAES